MTWGRTIAHRIPSAISDSQPTPSDASTFTGMIRELNRGPVPVELFA